MHSPSDHALASALRQLREASGGTQENVAHSAGLTAAALGRIERGQADPRWTTVTRILAAQGITLTELVKAVEDASV